nr:PREDICTED: transmembrane protein 255B [Apteryx mantelli mantelli]
MSERRGMASPGVQVGVRNVLEEQKQVTVMHKAKLSATATCQLCGTAELWTRLMCNHDKYGVFMESLYMGVKKSIACLKRFVKTGQRHGYSCSLGFGSFLAIVGIHLVENRRQMLVASIVFISFGVVAAFCCAIVDGVFAARHIEPRPLYNRRCQFYSSGIGFLYDAYQTEVMCYTLNSKCQLKIKSNTCYCCDLYNCENSEQSSSYYEFLGVSSCQDVVHLYRLLWSSTVLNIIGLFLGIITAAILGAFKDMVPLSQIAFSAAPPPQILYNPAQQILTYAGFCPSAATISTYPSYPLPLQLKSCAVLQSSIST